MIMKQIKTVIFDLGGVLIDWNPEYLYHKIFPDEEERKYFLQNVCTPEWNEEQDGGRPLKEATEALVKTHPQYETAIRAYYGRWHEMLNGPIEKTVDLLRQLKKKKHLKVYALTNWSAETFPIAYHQYDFLQWFEDIIVSGREHVRKPFPEIFQLLCDRFQINPEESLFIDDNLRNVKAAAHFGFQTIHFTTPEQLSEALKTNGLLS